MYILNGKEKAVIATIAARTRIDYLKKNHYTYIEDYIDVFDEETLISSENIEREFEIRNDININANEMELIFGDPYLLKSSKILTYKEKLVIYSYYWEETTDAKIGKELHIKGDTVRKIRERAIKKIKREYFYLKGIEKK